MLASKHYLREFDNIYLSNHIQDSLQGRGVEQWTKIP